MALTLTQLVAAAQKYAALPPTPQTTAALQRNLQLLAIRVAPVDKIVAAVQEASPAAVTTQLSDDPGIAIGQIASSLGIAPVVVDGKAEYLFTAGPPANATPLQVAQLALLGSFGTPTNPNAAAPNVDWSLWEKYNEQIAPDVWVPKDKSQYHGLDGRVWDGTNVWGQYVTDLMKD